MSLVADEYAGEDEEEEEELPQGYGGEIDLDCGPFRVAVKSWSELADKQMRDTEAQLSPADFDAEAGERTAFAFCYKNEVIDPWLQIFVVRDGAQVHLFDEAGGDVEDESAPAGRQRLKVEGKSTGFLDEWTDGFYSNAATDLASIMPGACASPAEDEAAPHSADDATAQDGEEDGEEKEDDERTGECSAQMIPSTLPQ